MSERKNGFVDSNAFGIYFNIDDFRPASGVKLEGKCRESDENSEKNIAHEDGYENARGGDNANSPKPV